LVLTATAVFRAEIESRIESTIGNLFWESRDVKWGEISGRAVEASKQTTTAIHVDLDGIAALGDRDCGCADRVEETAQHVGPKAP
jgi:hypothetical protein